MTVVQPSRHGTHEAGNAPVPGSPGGDAPAVADSVRAMLEARSIALVGASSRPGSFGSRMLEEALKSSPQPRVYPVNPRYAELAGRPCYPSLADLPEAPDLALLAVPDSALADQLGLAASVGAKAAVIFGNAAAGGAVAGFAAARCAAAGGAVAGFAASGGAAADGDPVSDARSLRQRLAAIASAGGMALCGAGCMGFVNVVHGLRAIGYTEPDPLPAGPVALVTHSGSVFSALLRTRRLIGFTLAVSSGQELVTTTPDYLDYALSQPETRVLALVLEAIRDGARLRRALANAASRDIPVVLLAVGASAGGRQMVAAHSGALAGSDGGWEALARAYGVHRVSDIAELTDTLELFAAGRRPRPAPATAPAPVAAGARTGLATVHDSGLERAHVVDLAESLGVPFAQISPATAGRLAALLDPGLVPVNPLDVWGTGADTRQLFGGCLLALADDPAVQAVALAVDLVHELDGDDSYPLALTDVAERTGKPLAVLSNLGSAIDPELAGQLRSQGIPVLEGTRSGLLALRHLLDHAATRPAVPAVPGARIDRGRQERGLALLGSGAASGVALMDLLASYGIAVARTRAAAGLDDVLASAGEIGYPVVLKTDEAAIAHKSDVGGVLVGLRDPAELSAAYAGLVARLGPRVLVSEQVPAGTEMALGLVQDPELGPLIVIGAGGVLVELLADRAVALPPVTQDQARELIGGLRTASLLAGARGAPAADLGSLTRAVCGLSQLALELGDQLEALDINPLICGPERAVAVDALAVVRTRTPGP